MINQDPLPPFVGSSLEPEEGGEPLPPFVPSERDTSPLPFSTFEPRVVEPLSLASFLSDPSDPSSPPLASFGRVEPLPVSSFSQAPPEPLPAFVASQPTHGPSEQSDELTEIFSPQQTAYALPGFEEVTARTDRPSELEPVEFSRGIPSSLEPEIAPSESTELLRAILNRLEKASQAQTTPYRDPGSPLTQEG